MIGKSTGLALSLFFTTGLAAAYTGFSSGNEFDVTVFKGQVHVRCQDPNDIGAGFHSCAFAEISPQASDRFVTDQQVDADKVELTAIHQNQKSRKKTAKFNPNKGESGKVNLLISTLFQRPLLGLGSNQVHYRMTKKGENVLEGKFAVQVHDLGTRQCRRLSLWGSSYICGSVAAACEEYMRQTTCP